MKIETEQEYNLFAKVAYNLIFALLGNGYATTRSD